MSIPLCPDVKPSEGFDYSMTFYTFEAGPYPSGTVLSRAGRGFGLYSCNWKISSQLPLSTFTTMFAHFVAMKGKQGRFDYIDPQNWDTTPLGIVWPRLYARTISSGVDVYGGSNATGTGPYDVPMIGSTSYTLYKNGTSLGSVSGVNYTFSSGTGNNGRDRVTMSSALVAGDILEWQATGRAIFPCKFMADAMTFQAFCASLATTGIPIQQVA